jgi:hypothetical protein
MPVLGAGFSPEAVPEKEARMKNDQTPVQQFMSILKGRSMGQICGGDNASRSRTRRSRCKSRIKYTDVIVAQSVASPHRMAVA